jgi:hypothetical protein
VERNVGGSNGDVACMLQTLLTIAGTVLSLLGAACAVVSYRGTWQDHGDGPLFPRVAAWIARVQIRVRRLLHKSPGTVVGVGGVVAAAASASGRMTVTGPAIPPDADLERKVELLIRRVENMEREATDDRSHQAREVAAVREAIDAASSNATRVVAEIEAKTKSMVLDSIRLQLLGLGFVGVGTVFLAVAGFMA